MSARLKDSELYWIDIYLQSWARWVNSDNQHGLGYPEQVATVKKEKTDPDKVWRRKQATTRTTCQVLPEWKYQLAMDKIVHGLNIEFKRVIFCHYEVRLKGDQVIECRIPIRRMRLLGRDGRYSWPEYRLERIEALGMPERTFRHSLNMARKEIIENNHFPP